MPSLLDLPPEILLNVAECLYPHYATGMKGELPQLYINSEDRLCSPEEKDAQVALSSLSRTCKALHRLAKPTLFRNPIFPACGSFVLFVCALISRPDLATLVRDLRIHDVEDGELPNLCFKLETMFRRTEILERLPELFDETEKQSSTRAPGETFWLQIATGYYGTLMTYGHISALAMSLTSNLEHLYLQGCNFWFPEPRRFERLMHLKDLVLEFRLDDREGWEMQEVQPILDAAPALNSLWVNNPILHRSISHQNLTELYLIFGLVKSEEFFNIMSTCPRLQTFVFHCWGFDTPEGLTVTPLEASDAVIIRSGTLKRLSLCYPGNPDITDHPQDTDGNILGNLKSMSILESLDISSSIIHTDSSIFRRQLERFPPSLKMLRIRTDEDSMDHVVDFSIMAVRDLQDLCELRIVGEFSEEQERLIEEACETAKVRCLFEPWFEIPHPTWSWYTAT